MDATKPLFACRELAHTYRGPGAFRLSDVSLELRPGEITGVVGVNGSGKTTLLRMVVGDLLPDSGAFAYPALHPEVAEASRLDWAEIKRQIAYMPQAAPRWVGRLVDNLHWQAGLHGLAPDDNEALVEHLLVRLGLEAQRDATWSQLSGGYKVRFELAKALAKRPKLIVLDEPLAPLDILAQKEFLQDLHAFATAPAAPLGIVLSSQHLYEVEAVAHHLVFLGDGRPRYAGKIGDLGEERQRNAFELSCDASADELRQALAPLDAELAEAGLEQWLVRTRRDLEAGAVLAALLAARIRIRYFRDVSRSSRMFFAEEVAT